MHDFVDYTSKIYRSGKKNYVYYSQINRINERVSTFGDNQNLLSEWITLDASKVEITRITRNLEDAFAKMGGL